jgi:hypothetical protein
VDCGIHLLRAGHAISSGEEFTAQLDQRSSMGGDCGNEGHSRSPIVSRSRTRSSNAIARRSRREELNRGR